MIYDEKFFNVAKNIFEKTIQLNLKPLTEEELKDLDTTDPK